MIGIDPIIAKDIKLIEFLEFELYDESRLPVVVATTLVSEEDDLTMHMALDVTSQRKTEDMLVDANSAAGESNQARSEFLAAMSHELRTPLNEVLGMTQLSSEAKPDSCQQRFVKGCQSGGNGLMSLIGDILEFLKIEAGKLELDEHLFDLLKLLDDLMSSMPARMNGRNVELIYRLHHPATLHLMGDSQNLYQAIVNLMSVAVRFTDEREISLLVKLEYLSDSEAQVLFSISNTGMGIPVDRQNRLFKSLSQVDNSISRQYEMLSTIHSALDQSDCRLRSDEAAVVRRSTYSKIPPIDHAKVVDRCIGNRAFAESTIDSFARDCSRRLKPIAEPFNDGDTVAMAEVAHSLRRIAEKMAAQEVQVYASKMEAMSELGGLGGIGSLVTQLRKSVDACLNRIADVFQKQSFADPHQWLGLC